MGVRGEEVVTADIDNATEMFNCEEGKRDADMYKQIYLQCVN